MAQTLQGVYLGSGDTIPYTPGTAVAAGDVVIQNELVGVAREAIAASAQGSLTVRGRMRFMKTANEVIAAGSKVFWNDSTNKATGTDTGVLLGYCFSASAAADTEVDVLLQPDVVIT